MESKNPLENIRNAILGSQLFGIENEISRLGVSDELMKISDALDSYYGIVREKKEEPSNEGGLIGVLNNINRNPGRYSSVLLQSAYDNPITQFGKEKFSNVQSLLGQVKEPLAKIKATLSKDNPLYLNISTIIASIAVSRVVSSINNYRPTSRDPYGTDLLSYKTGIDTGYYNLITSGTKVFRLLESFDMAPDFLDNFEENKKVIYSQNQTFQDRLDRALRPETSTSRKSSSGSGCLVMALVLSTSMLSCLGLIVTLFL